LRGRCRLFFTAERRRNEGLNETSAFELREFWLMGALHAVRDAAFQNSRVPAVAGAPPRRARPAASLIASTRLPALALPVPARPSAVPWSTEVRMIGSPSVTLTPPPKATYLRTG